MYNPKYKKSMIIPGKGEGVVIITGWAPLTVVSKKIDENLYTAIGNLYSPSRGITYLFANLGYNPQIKKIVFLSSTKEDKNSNSNLAAYKALNLNIFKGKDPLGEEKWVIYNDEGKNIGYIDKVIPYPLIQQLSSLDIAWCESIQELNIELGKEIPKSTNRVFFDINIPEIKSNTKPGKITNYTIRENYIYKAWYKILKYIRNVGIIRPTGYGGKWQECYNLTTEIDCRNKEEKIYFPENNDLPIDEEFLKGYVPQIVKDSPYYEGVKYTYGQRMRSWFDRDQIEQVIEKLSKEPDAASAVISLWDVKDHEKGGSPCLNHIWFRIFNSRIDAYFLFRSNDMFGAWVANVSGLFYLFKHVKDELNFRNDWNLELGKISTSSLSAHIYDDCFLQADNVKVEKDGKFYDEVGDFTIEVSDEKILVSRLHPDTKTLITTYSDKRINWKKLLNRIISDSWGIDPTHSAYLAIELHQAYIKGENYVQS